MIYEISAYILRDIFILLIFPIEVSIYSAYKFFSMRTTVMDYVDNYWRNVDKYYCMKRTYDLFMDVFQYFVVSLHRGTRKFEDAMIIIPATSRSQGGLFSRTLRNY